MTTEISAKKYHVFGRILLQILLLGVLLFAIYKTIKIYTHGGHLLTNVPFMIWFLGFAVLTLNIDYFLQLLFLPFWVIIDDESKSLEIKYLIMKSKVIEVHDITSYSTTVINLGRLSYFGIIMYLPKGKQILLSDLTLDNYTPVEALLTDLKVENLGEKKFSFISYYFHQ
jgi:hypothetical protein